MAEYKKFARPGNNNRPRSFGNSTSQSRELFDAECSKCHSRCQVPFRPNGKKPVYCANCFVKDEAGRETSNYRESSYQSDRRDFKPQSNRAPFAKPDVSDRQIQDLKRQVESMNSTLEKLVIAINMRNQSAELSREMEKYTAPEAASAKEETPAKKPVKKVAKKTVKKAAKK